MTRGGLAVLCRYCEELSSKRTPRAMTILVDCALADSPRSWPQNVEPVDPPQTGDRRRHGV